MAFENDGLSQQVIGLAIEVHRHLGPGLLESAYEECLCLELKEAGLPFRRQVPLPIIYKSIKLDCGYRLDLVVMDRLILESKDRRTTVADPQRAAFDVYEAERYPNRIALEL